MFPRQAHDENDEDEAGSKGDPERQSMARIGRRRGHVLPGPLRLLIMFVLFVLVCRSSVLDGIIVAVVMGSCCGIVPLEGGVEVEKDEIREGHASGGELGLDIYIYEFLRARLLFLGEMRSSTL